MEATAMAEALLFGEREARVLAAREIGNLSSKQKQRLAEKEAISALVFMLHSQDYESIEASLIALLNLAFGSERNKLRIAKYGAIPAILKILQLQNGPLLELALGALFVLSSCSANKPEIASSGVIQLICQLLNPQLPISHQSRLDMVSTLHNLSTSPQIVPSIVLSDGLGSLIQLVYVSEKSSDLVERTIALIESLVSSSAVALNQVSESGGAIRMVVEAVEEGTGPCKEHASGILLLICRSCRERYREMILREGAVPGLLQLSVDGTRRARKTAKALLLLLRDCDGSSSSSKKNVVFEEVMRQIDHDGVGRVGSNSLHLVEEMIAKLTT